MPSGTDKKDVNPNSLREKFRAIFQTPSVNKQLKEDPIALDRTMYEYNAHEIGVLMLRSGVKDTDTRRDRDMNTQTIMSTLLPTHQELVSAVADAERLKAIDPSLKQVENIIIASIMSPNDLQDRDPTITVTDVDIEESQKLAIEELLDEYYCKKYKIRDKMEHWAREAHFRSGAGVTLILPEASLASIISTYDPDRKLVKKSSVECLTNVNKFTKDGLSDKDISELNKAIYTKEMLNTIMDYDPYNTNKSNTTKVRKSTEGIVINEGKSLHNKKSNTTTKLNKELTEVVNKVYAELQEEYSEEFFKVSELINKDYGKIVKSAIENITININTSIGDNGNKLVTTNPEILRFGKSYQKYLDDNACKNIESIFHFKEYENNSVEYQESEDYRKKRNYAPIIDLTEHITNYKSQKSYPFTLDLPTEAVIPVCIPGSHTEHLGYFVLIDQFGHPIEASSYLVGDNNCSISGRINKAYTAMYGEVPTDSGIKSPLTNFNGTVGRNIQNHQKRSLQRVFNYILDGMLKNTVEHACGITDMTFGTYDTIAACMLSRLLEKKETKLVFVPSKYITYMAFNYHTHNGTGKSKLEDILFIESLKVSMMVANVLATMKNAVPYRKAELNLNKEQRNPQNVIMALRSAIAEKERVLPSIYPSVVAQQIISQNTSVKVNGPQTGEFSFNVEDDKRDLPTIDTDFLDKLDNMTITGLGAPVSAINEVAEVQYAKSVATTNIFFAKTISRDQNILTEHTKNHIRVHASLSSSLIYQIAAILGNKNDKESENVDLKTNVSNLITPDKLIKQNDTIIGILGKEISKEDFTKVMKIIDMIEVTLPAPIVAPDQSHYDMLDGSIKLINDYVDAIYPDDAIPSDYSELSNTLKVVKASIKSKAQRELANQLGMGTTMKLIPNLTEYMVEERANVLSMLGELRGMTNAIVMDQKQRTATTPEDDSSSGSSDMGW